MPEQPADASVLAALETEAQNPRTAELDALDVPQLLQALHAENHRVADAVDAALPQVVALVLGLEARLSAGGRLIYAGAGTSGRLGVLDASECPPTFGVPPGVVVGIIAGGENALRSSIEGAEDNESAGRRDLQEFGVQPKDTVVGIAASGRTPWVAGVLTAAREAGVLTALVTNVSRPALAPLADIVISAVTGAEPLTGSTRLLAGTAQKIVLNLVSTAAMVRQGKVYENLMVDVRATNAKLRDRAVRIVMAATATTRDEAEAAVAAAGGNAKTAIIMVVLQLNAAEAAVRLEAAGGWVRRALAAG